MNPTSPLASVSWRHAKFNAALVIATMAISFEVAGQPGPASPAPGDKQGTSSEKSDAATPTGTASPKADPSPAARCLNAHREGQTLRRQSRLLESRNLFADCSDAACPGPVQRDCLRWSREVTSQMPSIVFSVDAEAGEAVRLVKIFVDGELRFDAVPKRAVEINPGTHQLRFVVAGKPPVEQEVVISEAEKLKPITIKFATEQKQLETAPTTPREAPKPAAPPQRPTVLETRPTPLATYIFAGIGVVATVNFAAWGLSSKSLVSDLDGKCAPNCDASDIDRARSRALIADVSLGVGIASFTTAALWYFLRPAHSTPVEVDVGVLPRGGLAATVRIDTF